MFERKFKFNRDFDLLRSNKFQPNEVSQARVVELPDGSVKYQSDVALLLNEERLRKVLGLDTLKKWVEHLQPQISSSGVDTSKMNDAQLMSFIKSRYIQQPCELKAWSEYLSSCASELVEQYNRELERLEEAQQEELTAAQSAASAQTSSVSSSAQAAS